MSTEELRERILTYFAERGESCAVEIAPAQVQVSIQQGSFVLRRYGTLWGLHSTSGATTPLRRHALEVVDILT